MLKGVRLLNTWASQQHKYLNHGSREPVASKNITLRQVVPNFKGQVFFSNKTRCQFQSIPNLHMPIMIDFM